MVNSDGGSKELSKAEAGEHECGGGKIRRKLSTAPMPQWIGMLWHGAAVMTDSDWCLCALLCERGHRVVTG
jgi:hypothetical protein